MYNHVHPSNTNYQVNLNMYYRNLEIKNLQNGSIKNLLECHPARRVRAKKFLNNVSILYRSNDQTNLVIIAGTLYIHQFKLTINAKFEFSHVTLHLF